MTQPLPETFRPLRRLRALDREALATFAARVAWVGLEFLLSLALARLLGATEYGAYAMAISVATLCGGVAALGLDRLLIREVAVIRAQCDWPRLRGLLAQTTRWVLGVSLTAGMGVAIAAPWIAGDAGATAVDAMRFGALLVPAIAWSRQRQGALQGLGRVAIGQVPELLLQPILLLALLGVALMLNRLPTQASKVLLLQAGAALLTAIAGTWLLRGALPRAARASAPARVGTGWFRAAAPFTLLLLMTLALGQIDTLLLGVIRGASEAGPYRAASQIAAFTAFPMTAINLAAAPHFAARYAAGDIAALRLISRRAAFAGAVAGLVIAAALWISGPALLRLFGPGFDSAYRPLSLLTGAYALTTLAGASGYLLIMSRHATAAALLFTGATTISIAAQLLLIPSWGPLGAAAGTGLALCALTLGLGVTAQRLVRAPQQWRRL